MLLKMHGSIGTYFHPPFPSWEECWSRVFVDGIGVIGCCCWEESWSGVFVAGIGVIALPHSHTRTFLSTIACNLVICEVCRWEASLSTSWSSTMHAVVSKVEPLAHHHVDTQCENIVYVVLIHFNAA